MIADSGVSRVVIGIRDPHPRVDGVGADIVRAAGIEVVEDVCAREIRRQLAPWILRFHPHEPRRRARELLARLDLERALDALCDLYAIDRAAVERMPYLKSLNQVANDQKGSANLGASLAFFGMEDWALELAQQSFYPYWGGSHLFMADRYQGEINKNSALFQGFLTDPMAFGASQRMSSKLVKL